jgi:hypothetical protein
MGSVKPVPSTRTVAPIGARAGVAVTWGMPSTSRGPTVVVVAAAGRPVVTVVDGAGAAVVVVTSTVVDVVVEGAVGTGPSDWVPLSEHPPSTSSPMIARGSRSRRMSKIISGRRNAGIAVL